MRHWLNRLAEASATGTLVLSEEEYEVLQRLTGATRPNAIRLEGLSDPNESHPPDDVQTFYVGRLAPAISWRIAVVGPEGEPLTGTLTIHDVTIDWNAHPDSESPHHVFCVCGWGSWEFSEVSAELARSYHLDLRV